MNHLIGNVVFRRLPGNKVLYFLWTSSTVRNLIYDDVSIRAHLDLMVFGSIKICLYELSGIITKECLSSDGQPAEQPTERRSWKPAVGDKLLSHGQLHSCWPASKATVLQFRFFITKQDRVQITHSLAQTNCRWSSITLLHTISWEIGQGSEEPTRSWPVYRTTT